MTSTPCHTRLRPSQVGSPWVYEEGGCWPSPLSVAVGPLHNCLSQVQGPPRQDIRGTQPGPPRLNPRLNPSGCRAGPPAPAAPAANLSCRPGPGRGRPGSSRAPPPLSTASKPQGGGFKK